MRSIRRQLLFIFMAAMFALHNTAAFPLHSQEVKEESTADHSGPHDGPLQEVEDDDDFELLYGDLLEGDILVSEEDIETFDITPQMKELGHNVQKRSIYRNKNKLWPGGNVSYAFHSTVKNQKMIRQVMDTIEELTCLKFSPHTEESGNYLNITSLNGKGCNSFVGKHLRPVPQRLQLSPGCYSHRTIMHELFHAIGVFHEQSRPDRDEYVEVVEENIQEKYRFAFKKRNKFSVDSQGVSYDYASVMHYGLRAFLNTSKGDHTIRIVNEEEYERQGRPLHSRISTMSKKDATQINRLYNCPGSGVPGTLVIYLDDAENLPSNGDAVVAVTAYDDQGQSETKRTNYTRNESLDFGNRVSWQYIEINIVDENDKQLTPVQFFSVNAGLHKLQNCQVRRQKCVSTRLNFSLSLSDNCNCFSGGTCRTDGTMSCDCAEGFGGPHCEYLRGSLQIVARNATNLMNRDQEYVNNYSDAFLEIQAYDHHGNVVRKKSRVILNTLNPVWDEEIDFGVNDWAYFTIGVWDYDGSRRSRLGHVNSFPLRTFMSVEGKEVEAFEGGIVTFDYFFSLSYNCHCFSRGTCRTDGTMLCDCAEGFGGPHCEYPRGSLQIVARNATNLMNGDREYVNNYSDAFLEIQAYDHHGNVVRKKSRIIFNTLNPVWDEEIDFGVNDWANFTIGVWDYDGWDNDGTRRSRLGHVNNFPLRTFMSVEGKEIEALEGGIVTFDYFFG